jgi:large subunit ribosomal protein L23
MKNNNVFNATMYEDIILKPIVSEKSYDNIANGKYSFKVKKDANKYQIKEAVEKLFEVDVLNVNTMNYKGKPKRVGRHEGYKNDWKKAIVTLKDGQSIKFFESIQ